MHRPYDRRDSKHNRFHIKKDWLTFFQRAHFMTEKKVHSTINAFEMALYVKVSSKLRAQYELQDKNFDRISKYAKAEKAEGRAEGLAKGLAEGLAK